MMLWAISLAMGSVLAAGTLTDADLDRLERELADPAQRLSAVAALADFASSELYRIGSMSGGDPDLARRERRKRAARLAKDAGKVEIVAQALEADDVRLQQWALWFWNQGMHQALRDAGPDRVKLPAEGRTEQEEAWSALLPEMRRLAVASPYRIQAIRALESFDWPGSRDFLLERVRNETYADVLLHLCAAVTNPSNDAVRDARYNHELLRLLGSKKSEIRHLALAEIALNLGNAEMWQVRFDSEVKQRVSKLIQSKDPEDRRLAEWAAEGLRQSAKGKRTRR